MTLSLASLANRIEALEEEEFSGQDEKLSTWQAMVSFRFLYHRLGEAAKEQWHKVAPIEAQSALVWWYWKFDDLLPETNQKMEKAELLFAAVMDTAIEELGYTQTQLESSEAMDECIAVVANLLVNHNWTEFHNQKRQEAGDHEKWLLYRRLAHQGELTPEAADWLRLNDLDFLENMRIKNQLPDIDTLLTQLTKKVNQPLKPLESNPERIQRIEIQPPLPEVQPTPQNGHVQVQFFGAQPNGSFSIMTTSGLRPVVQGEVYELTLTQFEKLSEFTRQGDWKKVG